MEQSSSCTIAAAVVRAVANETLLWGADYEGSAPNDFELGWNAAVAYVQGIATEFEAE